MQIDISKEVTGKGQETYTGVLKITAQMVVDFKQTTEYGQDLRDTDPDIAKHMVEDAKNRITQAIAGELHKIVIEEMEKVVKTKGVDFIVTPHVEKRLLLVNPNEMTKVVKEKEKEEVKKVGVSVRDKEKGTPRTTATAETSLASRTTIKRPSRGKQEED